MDKNTVFALNNAIYQIYNTKDFDETKRNLLTAIRALIPCTFGAIFMADHKSGEDSVCNPVCIPEKYEEMENNYSSVKKWDFSRWIVEKKQSVLVKASSLMDEEERIKTNYYQQFYKPYQMHYAVYLTIANHNEFLELLALYRKETEKDFSSDDLFLLQLLSEHINERFYSQKKSKETISIDMKNKGIYISRYGLTEREAEIMYLILTGFNNAEICEQLIISPNTLKKHMQNIYRKAGVHSRVQLIGLEA